MKVYRRNLTVFLKKEFFGDFLRLQVKATCSSLNKKIPDVLLHRGLIYHLKSILHFLCVLQELSQTDISQWVFQQTQD